MQMMMCVVFAMQPLKALPQVYDFLEKTPLWCGENAVMPFICSVYHDGYRPHHPKICVQFVVKNGNSDKTLLIMTTTAAAAAAAAATTTTTPDERKTINHLLSDEFMCNGNNSLQSHSISSIQKCSCCSTNYAS